MLLIFSASGDSSSFQHSSRIIEPLLLWLFPGINAQTTYSVIMAVRKCAHLTEYAILVTLLWRALSSGIRGRRWEWRPAWQALLVVVLYAASDEFHQKFVPTREASVLDVAIDTLGAVAGLILIRSVHYLQCKGWKRDKSSTSAVAN